MFFIYFFFLGFISATKCDSSYVPFQESCYQLSDATKLRAEASAACRPGHLVDITSPEEQKFVTRLLEENNVTEIWIGLLKTLVWSDGSPFVHEPWQEIETTDGASCFRLRKSRSMRWDDKPCGETFRSICEYEGIHFI